MRAPKPLMSREELIEIATKVNTKNELNKVDLRYSVTIRQSDKGVNYLALIETNTVSDESKYIDVHSFVEKNS